MVLSLYASLQKLPNMVCVLSNLTILYDDVDDAAITGKAGKGLFYPAIVMY